MFLSVVISSSTFRFGCALLCHPRPGSLSGDCRLSGPCSPSWLQATRLVWFSSRTLCFLFQGAEQVSYRSETLWSEELCVPKKAKEWMWDHRTSGNGRSVVLYPVSTGLVPKCALWVMPLPVGFFFSPSVFRNLKYESDAKATNHKSNLSRDLRLKRALGRVGEGGRRLTLDQLLPDFSSSDPLGALKTCPNCEIAY